MHHLPLAKATFSLLLLPPHPPPSTVALFCTLRFHLAGRSNNHQNAATNSTPLCSARAPTLVQTLRIAGLFQRQTPGPCWPNKTPTKPAAGKILQQKSEVAAPNGPVRNMLATFLLAQKLLPSPFVVGLLVFAPLFRRTVKCADVKKRSNTQPMNFYAS